MFTLTQHFIANDDDAVQIGKTYHNKAHPDPETFWNYQPANIKLKRPFHPSALPENRAIRQKNKE